MFFFPERKREERVRFDEIVRWRRWQEAGGRMISQRCERMKRERAKKIYLPEQGWIVRIKCTVQTSCQQLGETMFSNILTQPQQLIGSRTQFQTNLSFSVLLDQSRVFEHGIAMTDTFGMQEERIVEVTILRVMRSARIE